MKHILVFIALLLTSAFVPALAGNVTVSWQPPNSCADGSTLPNCPTTGYEIAKGATPTDASYTPVETVSAGTLTKTYANLTPGQVCYSLKTVSGSQKSAESNRACVTVPSLPPKAPAGISVTVEVTVTTSTP